MRRAMASTMKVMTNRMRPSRISDGSVEVADRLGELVGDGRRDGGAGRHDRGGDAVRVADDEGDRHGLAQRAAEPQHDAADDADAGKGQHDIAHHFPGGAADAIGRFLEHRRHRLEHVARDRGDEGQHHDGEDQAGGEDADAVGRAGEQGADAGNIAQGVDQERLQGLLQERREHEQAPDAVDDARGCRRAVRWRCRSGGAATSGTVR